MKNKKQHGAKKIKSAGKTYEWDDSIERLSIVREGLPYDCIEYLSENLEYPIKDTLEIMDIPQTTYNKKKKENSLMDSRDSELVMLIMELIDYGTEVFNNERDKFLRWMKKENISLGGFTPESYLDTVTGIQEVKKALDRIEYGNVA